MGIVNRHVVSTAGQLSEDFEAYLDLYHMIELKTHRGYEPIWTLIEEEFEWGIEITLLIGVEGIVAFSEFDTVVFRLKGEW